MIESLKDFINTLNPEQARFLGSVAQAVGTILAAIIIGIAGAWITGHFNKKRDKQDKESQWRSHAIELTKLDLDRKKAEREAGSKIPLWPSILDFLANYRELSELGTKTPKELYNVIKEKRITKHHEPDEAQTASNNANPADSQTHG